MGKKDTSRAAKDSAKKQPDQVGKASAAAVAKEARDTSKALDEADGNDFGLDAPPEFDGPEVLAVDEPVSPPQAAARGEAGVDSGESVVESDPPVEPVGAEPGSDVSIREILAGLERRAGESTPTAAEEGSEAKSTEAPADTADTGEGISATPESELATPGSADASTPEPAADAEPAPQPETSTPSTVVSTKVPARHRSLAALQEASDVPDEEEDDTDAESTRSLQALIAEVDEKVALLPGEEALASDSQSDSQGDSEQYISFTLSDSRYGIPIRQVSEMERMPSTSWVPHVPNFVLGVTNLRGDITAVIDLSQFLGFGAAEHTDLSRIVVVKVGSESLTCALVVDRVLGLSVVDSDRVREPEGPVDDKVATLLRGVYEDGDNLVNLLDMDRVFRTSELRTLFEE